MEKINFKLIREAGYTPFQRDPKDTWCYYTDGKNIAYIQLDHRAYRIASVHKGSRHAGTGYIIQENWPDINPAILKVALETVTPPWANQDQVVKYRDWQEFWHESEWNMGYKEVPND